MGKWEPLGPAALRVEDRRLAVRVDIDSYGARFTVNAEPLKADLHGAGAATRIGIVLTEPVTTGAIYLTISPLPDAPSKATEDRAALKVVTKQDIAEGLAALGVRAGDALLVHSSLSRFGHVEGGADAVIDALLEAVGPGAPSACPPTPGAR